jgi:hypothetical protein
MPVVVKAFKAGFAASNETRAVHRIRDAGCTIQTDTAPESLLGRSLRATLLTRGLVTSRPMRLLQVGATSDLSYIGVSLVVVQGAGAGYGTVEGQANVRSSISDITEVPVSDVAINFGAYLKDAELCNGKPCASGSSGTDVFIPVALRSLATATSPTGLLSASFSLPSSIESASDVLLSFDVCGVPAARQGSVQGQLATAGNCNLGNPVQVSGSKCTLAQGYINWHKQQE